MISIDGVALQSISHPFNITEEMLRAGIEQVRIHDGNDAVLAREVYQAMRHAEPPEPDFEISDDALEDAEIDLPFAVLLPDEVETVRKMLADYGFEYGLTADPEKVAALKMRFGATR